LPLFDTDVQQHTIEEGLKLHCGFVRLDFCQDFSALHGISYVLQPTGHHPFGHGVTQLGHAHNFSHISDVSGLALRIQFNR
jgi:hypothetical protein